MAVSENTEEAEDWAVDLMPRVLPADWHEVPGLFGRYESRDGIRVIFSARKEADGKRWVHVSASRAGRVPSWDDLRRVKALFIGQEKMAIQVLPRESEYVNCHPFVLHLWHSVDGDPVPDFRRGGLI
jgi:hypothetical protein